MVYREKSDTFSHDRIGIPSEHDWKDAVQLSDEKIKEFVDEVVNYLLSNPKEEWWYIRTGDTTVLGIRWKTPNVRDQIEVNILRNRTTYQWDLET